MKHDVVGSCPICHNDIYEYDRAYGCSNFNRETKKGCRFKVFKVIAGKNITKPMLNQLIEKRRIENVDGFISKKTGIAFSGSLVFDKDYRKVNIELADSNRKDGV